MYSSADKTTTITSIAGATFLPTADFILPEGLIAGQQLTYEDKSSDPLGRRIVDHVWIIAWDGTRISTDSLTDCLSKPAHGEYLISLRVKNSAGLWSDLTTRSLIVAPNNPPEVLGFTSRKARVAVGEDLHFVYTVANDEEWEEITAKRWSYSWHDGNQWHVRREKPRALFIPGEHVIALQVRDEYGNWSEEATTPITVIEHVSRTEAQFKFSDPVPGELFLNQAAVNFNLLADATAVTVQSDEVTQIASNSPEQIREPGILYRDRASGRVIVRYHHQNQAQFNINVWVLAQNTSDEPVALLLSNRGVAGPSTDIMQVGQQVAASFLQSNHHRKLTLLPGETVILNKEQGTASPGDVVAGMLEVHASGEVVFTVAACKNLPAGDSPDMPVLNRADSHVRGTFPGTYKHIDVELTGVAPEKIAIGRDDAFPDHFLRGVDSTTGEQVTNRGNWGVVYTITISSERTVGVLFNPRGTVFKGAMVGCDDETWLLPNAAVLNGSREGVILGTIGAGETMTIRYVPPGGSDTPFLLVFIPKDNW